MPCLPSLCYANLFCAFAAAAPSRQSVIGNKFWINHRIWRVVWLEIARQRRRDDRQHFCEPLQCNRLDSDAHRHSNCRHLIRLKATRFMFNLNTFIIWKHSNWVRDPSSAMRVMNLLETLSLIAQTVSILLILSFSSRRCDLCKQSANAQKRNRNENRCSCPRDRGQGVLFRWVELLGRKILHLIQINSALTSYGCLIGVVRMIPKNWRWFQQIKNVSKNIFNLVPLPINLRLRVPTSIEIMHFKQPAIDFQFDFYYFTETFRSMFSPKVQSHTCLEYAVRLAHFFPCNANPERVHVRRTALIEQTIQFRNTKWIYCNVHASHLHLQRI